MSDDTAVMSPDSAPGLLFVDDEAGIPAAPMQDGTGRGSPCCYQFGIMLSWVMRIIALSTLRAFWEKYPDAETPLRAWYALASRASWMTPADIKGTHRNASFTANRRVVFNIKCNDYRMVVAVRYERGLMYVRFVGTHRQYDRINVETI